VILSILHHGFLLDLTLHYMIASHACFAFHFIVIVICTNRWR